MPNACSGHKAIQSQSVERLDGAVSQNGHALPDELSGLAVTIPCCLHEVLGRPMQHVIWDIAKFKETELTLFLAATSQVSMVKCCFYLRMEAIDSATRGQSF
ncbi:hypothetical protein D3C71_1466420 [compost metagenome]